MNEDQRHPHDFFLGDTLIGRADLGVDRSMGMLMGTFRPTEGYGEIQPFFQEFSQLLVTYGLSGGHQVRIDEMRREWQTLDLRCVDAASGRMLLAEWIQIDDFAQDLDVDAQWVTVHIENRDYWENYDRLRLERG